MDSVGPANGAGVRLNAAEPPAGPATAGISLEPQVSVDDLLRLIGRQQVEIAYLRALVERVSRAAAVGATAAPGS